MTNEIHVYPYNIKEIAKRFGWDEEHCSAYIDDLMKALPNSKMHTMYICLSKQTICSEAEFLEKFDELISFQEWLTWINTLHNTPENSHLNTYILKKRLQKITTCDMAVTLFKQYTDSTEYDKVSWRLTSQALAQWLYFCPTASCFNDQPATFDPLRQAIHQKICALPVQYSEHKRILWHSAFTIKSTLDIIATNVRLIRLSQSIMKTDLRNKATGMQALRQIARKYINLPDQGIAVQSLAKPLPAKTAPAKCPTQKKSKQNHSPLSDVEIAEIAKKKARIQRAIAKMTHDSETKHTLQAQWKKHINNNQPDQVRSLLRALIEHTHPTFLPNML